MPNLNDIIKQRKGQNEFFEAELILVTGISKDNRRLYGIRKHYLAR